MMSWSPCKISIERAEISKQRKWVGHGKVSTHELECHLVNEEQ